MPKALSLKKKTPQPGKEQLSITTFFKNASEKKPPTGYSSTEPKDPTQVTKRKASSPIAGNRTKVIAESTCSNNPCNVDQRMPLIEILDSPSNSPPLTDSLEIKFNSNSPRPEHKPETVKLANKSLKCKYQTTFNGNKQEVRRSPRKIEKEGSNSSLNLIKTGKVLFPEKQDSIEGKVKKVHKNNDLDTNSTKKLNILPDQSNKKKQQEVTLSESPSKKKQNRAVVIFEKNETSKTYELKENKLALQSDALNYVHSVTKNCFRNGEEPPSQVSPKEQNPAPRHSPRKLGQLSTHKDLIIEEPILAKGCQQNAELNRVEPKSAETDGIFDDEWSMDDIQEALEAEDLDLSMWQRCEIEYITQTSDRSSKVKLKGSTGKRATCIVEGIWNSLPLRTGDTVSVLASRVEGEGWQVTDAAGLLVAQPDVLLSSTAVVGAVFCRRKAALQETFHGMQPPNTAMTIGILVHELLQLALQKRLRTVPDVQEAVKSLLSTTSAVHLLYDADLTLVEAEHQMNTFVPQVVRFVDEYVVNQRPDRGNKSRKADEWNGRIEQVLDIEENVVTPQLGLKGKIDVTLLVNIHNKKGAPELAPLELKTGRASASAEHRGQLILYMMMMSLQSSGRPVSQGLLLYLRDIISLKVVSSGYPEQRDLIMLRNQLAQYLAPRVKSKPPKREDSGTKESSESEGSEDHPPLENLELPEPINHHACSKCEYLTLCSLYQWHTKSPALSQEHTLSKLRQEALGHLSAAHVEYFMRWTALLLLEDLEKLSLHPLHHIWTVPPWERERRGRCLSELEVADVQPSGARFLHTFVRRAAPPSAATNDAANEPVEKESCTMAAGDYVVVSTERKVWIAAGFITHLDADIACIALERELLERNDRSVRYHVDAYESQRQLGFNFTNLAALMDKDDKSRRLRELIIDRKIPEFSERLGRDVGRLGTRLLKPLNLLQQRAVLRALAAHHYTLVHGMPGTGKTQTVVVLVEMLVALGQKVLVTAHTHSAVDNVLQRLPGELRVLRLGAAARVSPRLAHRTEDALTARYATPDDLSALYDSMDVVGVTCLGAGHSLLTKRTFDVCIVDESTQVVQSTVLRPLLAARRFVLVGDPEQLPPLVRSTLARKVGMSESMFARLRGASGAAAGVSLSAQYRMNARVAALANRFTYGGELTCACPRVADAHLPTDDHKLTELYSMSFPWLVDCLSPRMDLSVLVLDTGCTAGWRAVPAADAAAPGRSAMNNAAEALVVMAIVKALFLARLDPDNIGVITPYRDQVALLKKCVANLQSSVSPRRRSPRKAGNTSETPCVEVNTVDQYQGRDKSVIIYSCCKTWDPATGDYTVKDSEILEDKRRLTVAITRAKHKLIVIGDATALRHYTTFGQLFRCLREMDDEGDTQSEIQLQNPYDALHEELGGFL